MSMLCDGIHRCHKHEHEHNLMQDLSQDLSKLFKDMGNGNMPGVLSDLGDIGQDMSQMQGANQGGFNPFSMFGGNSFGFLSMFGV
jgi:hypothetical protein